MKSIENVTEELKKRIEACDVEFYERGKKLDLETVEIKCINETSFDKKNPKLLEFQGVVEYYIKYNDSQTIQNEFANFTVDIELDENDNIPKYLRIDLIIR